MPQQVDDAAMREMKEVILPAAKPAQIISERVLDSGEIVPGKVIPARTVPGTIPVRDIPHMEFPKIVYKHPTKAYKRMYLPVDGHGNKDWQWVPQEATTRKVANEEEFKAALKQGFQAKNYVMPAEPLEPADPEQAEAAKAQ